MKGRSAATSASVDVSGLLLGVPVEGRAAGAPVAMYRLTEGVSPILPDTLTRRVVGSHFIDASGETIVTLAGGAAKNYPEQSWPFHKIYPSAPREIPAGKLTGRP